MSTMRRLERRRGPLGGIELLHVVHEVEAERALGAGVERREHAGLAVGRDDARRCWKPASRASFAMYSAPSCDVAVLGGDGGQRDPVLQALDVAGMLLADLCVDRVEIRRCEEEGESDHGRNA